ncbi:hypothetical protein [Burkholderia sp. Bp9031]|uniref:hypothetical protein n=1 Tax=Burkholderia sp. Bp9031 TaxID=2184566 RepID=UPI000B1E7BFA|nr:MULTISPECIES: hypothetical protein [Burkholderia]
MRAILPVVLSHVRVTQKRGRMAAIDPFPFGMKHADRATRGSPMPVIPARRKQSLSVRAGNEDVHYGRGTFRSLIGPKPKLLALWESRSISDNECHHRVAATARQYRPASPGAVRLAHCVVLLTE